MGGRSPVLACLGLCAAACVAPLELPEPPAVADGERAYETPTAPLSASTAEAIIVELLDHLRRLDELDGLRPVVDALVRFDDSVTRAGEGDERTVLVEDVPIRTDAVIHIFVDCPGWAEDGPVIDAVELTVVVRGSELVPVAWGPISACRLELAPAGAPLRVELDGEMAAYLPTIFDDGESDRRIYVAYSLTALIVNDEPRASWSGDFRVVGDLLEVRVELATQGYVVALAGHDPGVIGVRASNGEWRCYLTERRCERRESPSDSFSY